MEPEEHGTKRAGDRAEVEERAPESRNRSLCLRLGAILLTGMVIMCAVMFAGTYEWSRIFMALTMCGAMGLVMPQEDGRSVEA